MWGAFASARQTRLILSSTLGLGGRHQVRLLRSDYRTWPSALPTLHLCKRCASHPVDGFGYRDGKTGWDQRSAGRSLVSDQRLCLGGLELRPLARAAESRARTLRRGSDPSPPAWYSGRLKAMANSRQTIGSSWMAVSTELGMWTLMERSEMWLIVLTILPDI